MSKEIVVIGGGPAGIEAARAAAKAGAKVTIVTDAPLGGRAGWHSLLPSKVWLNAADTLGAVQHAGALGVQIDGTVRPNPAAVLARINAVAQSWNGQQAAELAALGVETVTGTARFVDSTTVEVTSSQADGRQLTAAAFIVAAGSVPVFPPNMKPDGKRILAPRFAGKLATLPQRVVVIGAGATGTEFVYLFNRLGVAVTWVIDRFGVLPPFAPEAGKFMVDVMRARGVTLVEGQFATQIDETADGITVTVEDGTSYPADMAFLAIGRRADVSRLNLDAVGLEPATRGELVVDAFGRTAVPTIYAVGDVSGGPMLANQATAQARIAGRHAAGVAGAHYQPETVIHAIYAEPQIAQVGIATAGTALAQVGISYAAGMKAHLVAATATSEPVGFVNLIYEPVSRVVRGGVAAGLHAADVLAPVAMAIQSGATIDDLAQPGGAYPTVTELAFLAAQEAL